VACSSAAGRERAGRAWHHAVVRALEGGEHHRLLVASRRRAVAELSECKSSATPPRPLQDSCGECPPLRGTAGWHVSGNCRCACTRHLCVCAQRGPGAGRVVGEGQARGWVTPDFLHLGRPLARNKKQVLALHPQPCVCKVGRLGGGVL